MLGNGSAGYSHSPTRSPEKSPILTVRPPPRRLGSPSCVCRDVGYVGLFHLTPYAYVYARMCWVTQLYIPFMNARPSATFAHRYAWCGTCRVTALTLHNPASTLHIAINISKKIAVCLGAYF